MYSWILRNAIVPPLVKLTHSRFWDAYRQMLRFERLPLANQQAQQWDRFKDLLGHAYEQVPFHRERMDAAGVTPDQITSLDDLHRIPITTKEQIQRNFPDRITAGDSNRDDWQYVSTRGTANRLMAIHDFRKRDMVRASAIRAMHLSGDYRIGRKYAEIPPDICNIVCGDEGQTDDGVLPHAWRMTVNRQWRDARAISDLRGLIERGWVFRKKTYQPFGPQGTSLPDDRMRLYVDKLHRDRPYVLKALPTYLYEIAQYVHRHSLQQLPVRVVKPMGSSVSPAMKAVIESAFEGNYREDYGSAEFGDMACDCDSLDGLHVFMDLFLIEVVRDGRPTPAGQVGKVLITDLSNRAMPFLRYEIGDVGRIVTDPCPCGRSAPRVYIEGRLQDTIVTQNGKVITNDQMMDHFYSRDDVDEFQVLEKHPGRFELSVVPNNGSPPSDDNLRDHLRSILEDEADITVHTVKSIRPEASGKFRFVKSCTFERLDESPIR
jgi:phenylacetate-CoA ligase